MAARVELRITARWPFTPGSDDLFNATARFGTASQVDEPALDTIYRKRAHDVAREDPLIRWTSKMMKKFRFALLCSTVVLGASCTSDDDTATLRKGVVDDSLFSGTVQVSVQGATGSVAVPFKTPVPDVPDSDLQDELDGAVSLVVASPRSGASADLASGTMVDGDPSKPGEFSWKLNSARNQATLTFFNESSGGLTLDNGSSYTAMFSLSTNDYVSRQSPIAFDVEITQ